MSMGTYKLTHKQKEFLQRVKNESPFNSFNVTIPAIIIKESYDDRDRATINDCIRQWMQQKK